MTKRIVLWFSASWCGPCHALDAEFLSKPEQRKLMNSYDLALKVDIDKYPKYAKKWGISSVPQLIIVEVKDNKTTVLERWTPTSPRTRLKTILGKFVPKKRLTFLKNMLK